MKFGNLVEICLWPHLAVKGLKRSVWDDLAGERSNIVMKSLILRLQVLFLFTYFLYFSLLTGSF